jgi:hypothetical protein
MSGEESDSTFYSQGSQFSSASQGYNADDELDVLIKADVFDRDTITKEEQKPEEKPEEKLEQKIKEEREEAKAELAKTVKDPIQIEEQLTQQEYFEEDEEEEKASQAVDTLTIKLNDEANKVEVSPPVVPAPPVDPPTAKRIRTPASRYSEYLQEKTIKEVEKEAKKQAPPTPQPEPAVLLNTSLGSQYSQQAIEQAEQDSFSQATFARSIIIDNIRLEPITPDSQARKIFTDEELTAMTSCYLCGCKFKDRISAKHNERWNYPEDQITASYDHTAPVNFSMVVVRVPSSYGSYEPFEKDFLKLNGKMACFHCNYTKSQTMFITCPKNGEKIKFENFAPNKPAIEKFVKDLWNSESQWSKDPNGENTLHKCVGKDIKKWRKERIKAITDSAQLICNMIKKHVDQKKVLKRLYYIKLLIAKARELLKTDPYFNNETIKASRRKAYGNRFIIDFVAKAEATDPKFVKPWSRLGPIYEETNEQSSEENSQNNSMNQSPISSPISSPIFSPISSPASSPANISSIKRPNEDGQGFSPRPDKTPKLVGSSRKRKQTRKRKNKRKTYRGVRLF